MDTTTASRGAAVEPSDQDLFVLAKTGDTAAFRRIVETNQGFAYSVAVRFLGNAQDAEDAVQEAFVRIWLNLSKYDPGRKFTTWMYRILANVCLDRIKSEKRGRLQSLSPEVGDPSAAALSDDDPARTIQNQDSVRLVRRLVRELPAKQRMVFILRDLEDLSVEEVSTSLDMPRPSVKSNLCLARAFLRRRILEFEDKG
jgi:RNA polymerase sigma-70 factor, ECF subfamily